MTFEPFQFKAFRMQHHRSSMKIGTDAVLLGAWACVNGAKRILDVGTGSGVIALMIAQRTTSDVVIEAIDIDRESVEEASANARSSPWSEKINIHRSSLQEFQSLTKFDLIISNPPFFQNSLLPPAPSRQQARHDEMLSFEDLIFHSTRLLQKAGQLSLILPFAEGRQFKTLAAERGLFLVRETAVFTKASKPQERWLLEFSLSTGKKTTDKIILFEQRGTKTDAYRELTHPFYL